MRKTFASLSALWCIMVMLAGCGQSQSAQPVDFDKNDVTFTGANSITYEKAYNSTKSDAVRKILIDEHRSEEHTSELQSPA